MATTVDTVALAALINKCFANATNLQFSLADQKNFLIEGKRLRGLLLNLLSAQFNEGTAPLTIVNTSLTKVNAKLSDDAAVLAHTAQTLSDIATLVGNLDGLLKVAVAFL